MERQDDPAAVIPEVAGGKPVTEALLDRVGRGDLIEWLGGEINGLLNMTPRAERRPKFWSSICRVGRQKTLALFEVKLERLSFPE